MTSVLRRIDQIPERVRYLLVTMVPTADVSANLSSPGVYAFTVPQTTFGPIDQVQDGTLASVGATISTLTIGKLYRDTGRSLYVYNYLGAGGLQVAIFRQVIPMSGYNSEGISAIQDSSTKLYVKVWSATGNGVVVSRTG
jgi:hypothetical protein